MSTRAAIDRRLDVSSDQAVSSISVRLPDRLKTDRGGVRLALLQRLAASRVFAYGGRAGRLRTAEERSGRSFRLDVRQRVIVKALVSRHIGKGPARGAALGAHVAYLLRPGAGQDGERGAFFNRTEDDLAGAEIARNWAEDRHHFRFIVSPEHGDRIADLKGYTRTIMERVSEDLGEPELTWAAACHFDTDQPHAHVLIRGRREDGRDLVIPRAYIGYGFRARAQEVAQELLGDLTRQDAEKRVWRETRADRYTGFDRRLTAAADAEGLVDDGVGGSDTWTALTRGRLRHLETLGLAQRIGRRYRLPPDLEAKLRRLQLSKDIIRTLNQRRLAGAREVEQLERGVTVSGKVVATGHHDELGGSPWLMLKRADGVEVYARLPVGQDLPRVGRSLTMTTDERGFGLVLRASDRSAGLGR